MAGSNGQDSLANVERLQFDDVNLALDIYGPDSAGGIYRIYEAAFNRTPDKDGLGFWINELDTGLNALDICEEFIWSREFQELYDVGEPADAYFTGEDIHSMVSGFYQNILERDPASGGLTFYVNAITNQQKTVATVLAEMADSEENFNNTITHIESGLQYDLWTA